MKNFIKDNQKMLDLKEMNPLKQYEDEGGAPPEGVQDLVFTLDPGAEDDALPEEGVKPRKPQ